MATKKPKLTVRRKVETVREHAEKLQRKAAKTPRRKKAATAAAKPVHGLVRLLGKEVQLIKLPANKLGNFLTKRRYVIPRYIVTSFRELRQVTWPNRREAAQLTISVILFSVIIAAFVKAVDFGFEKLFREVVLK